MIVNPWLFYWMNACSSIRVIAIIMMIISTFTTLFLTVFACMTVLDEQDEVAVAISKKAAKISASVLIASTLSAMFVPDKDTLLMMQAARLATTDNVNMIFEALKNAVDYVVSVLV